MNARVFQISGEFLKAKKLRKLTQKKANDSYPIELSHLMTRVLLQTITSWRLSWLAARRASKSAFE